MRSIKQGGVSDHETRLVLSARAGEEARVEGFEAGADDYVVKPFTARELVTRVATHLNMAKIRRQAERLRRLYDTILSNTPDLAYVFDLDHRFIYANKALLAIWGKTWEEAIGKNYLELGYEPLQAEMHDREIEQVVRISHLTKQTLGFYRETKASGTVQIGSTVNSILAVFAGKMRNKGILAAQEIEGDREIVGVPGEIRQLIANLLSNSIDAVGTGGRIRIRVSSITNGSQTGVRITVADSGSGIPYEVRSKLFEPFFTTKKEVGTGLGLWVCKSIVEKHKGSIRVKSSTVPGKSWTAFSVFLPVLEEVAGEETLKRAV